MKIKQSFREKFLMKNDILLESFAGVEESMLLVRLFTNCEISRNGKSAGKQSKIQSECLGGREVLIVNQADLFLSGEKAK